MAGDAKACFSSKVEYRKPTARWIPKALSDKQMAARASVCSTLLKRFRSKDDFLFCLVTVDETQCHHWVGPGSIWVPKKFKTQPSAGKVMATLLWDTKGVMLDFLPKRSTVTGVYYANLLDQLRTAIGERGLGKLSKRVLLQQDNMRVHTCKVAMDVVERNRYELILHSAYSPDLAPRDFFLFPTLKKDNLWMSFPV